jgi:very-short-patch-repair endonuclease
VNTVLAQAGWHVVRIWEHALRTPDKVLLRVTRALSRTVAHRSGRRQRART